MESVVVVVGKVGGVVWAEHVDGGTASSLEPFLSFYMGAAAAADAVVAVVAVVAVFCANYYCAHHRSFLLLCPWHCCLLHHHLRPDSQGYRAGMAH